MQLDDPQAQALAVKASRQLQMAQGYTIDSAMLYEAAADDLKAIKTQAKELEEKRKAMTIPIDNAKKAIMDFFRAPANYLEQAEQIIKGAMLAYQAEEEKKRRAEQARADELARQERERIQREAAAAAAEAARIEAEAAAERKRIADEAAAALAAGDAAEAERLQEAAAISLTESVIAAEQAAAEQASARAVASIIMAPPVAPVTKTKGIATVEKWKARVVDKAALIAHVAANPQYSELLTVNDTALNAQARSLKGSLLIPGVEAYPEQTISARAA